MNFVKYNKKNHIEIQPAALALSGLEHSPQMEMHTLDYALVLLKDNMSEAEQIIAMSSLVKLVNSMMTDFVSKLCEEEDDANQICIDDTDDGGVIVSIGGHKMFELSPDTVAELDECGIAPEMLVDMLLNLTEGEDDA